MGNRRYPLDDLNMEVVEGMVNRTRTIVEEAPLKQIVITDGAKTYICKAECATPTNVSKWQVKMVDETNPTYVVFTWADGNSKFDNDITDVTLLKYL